MSPETNPNSTSVPGPPAPEQTAEPVSQLLPIVIPPGIERSQAAFRRDLSELLKTHYFQWVAYHGDERVGFGRTQFELYDKCFRLGLSEDEFVVRSVEPEMPDEIDAEELWDV